MKTLLKGFGFFVALVIILSITINTKPLFSYIYQVISPATNYAQNIAQDLLNGTVKSAQDLTKKLFDNSVPKQKDTLKTKYSAPKRGDGTPQEEIVVEEKEQLDELIKTHR
jgi:hypothetical protein